MTTEELEKEYLELIKYYEQMVFCYRNYSDYESYECTYPEAEMRLEYYKRKYNELKEKHHD